MKLIIDIEKDYYELIKYNVEHGQKYKPFEIIANSTPYEERPKGKWVKSKDGYTRCDQCGSRGSAIKARFCHHCGADMRGDSE